MLYRLTYKIKSLSLSFLSIYRFKGNILSIIIFKFLRLYKLIFKSHLFIKFFDLYQQVDIIHDRVVDRNDIDQCQRISLTVNVNWVAHKDILRTFLLGPEIHQYLILDAFCSVSGKPCAFGHIK